MKTRTEDAGTTDMVEGGNSDDNATASVGRGSVFEVSEYDSYSVDDASKIPDMVVAGAGPR